MFRWCRLLCFYSISMLVWLNRDVRRFSAMYRFFGCWLRWVK